MSFIALPLYRDINAMGVAFGEWDWDKLQRLISVIGGQVYGMPCVPLAKSKVFAKPVYASWIRYYGEDKGS